MFFLKRKEITIPCSITATFIVYMGDIVGLHVHLVVDLDDDRLVGDVLDLKLRMEKLRSESSKNVFFVSVLQGVSFLFVVFVKGLRASKDFNF